MFGYFVKSSIPISEVVERLENSGISTERRSGEIVFSDDRGNQVRGHEDENGVKFFWRTAGNDAASIMQTIADVFGQKIFSDLPEYYGEDPLYAPEDAGCTSSVDGALD